MISSGPRSVIAGIEFGVLSLAAVVVLSAFTISIQYATIVHLKVTGSVAAFQKQPFSHHC